MACDSHSAQCLQMLGRAPLGKVRANNSFHWLGAFVIYRHLHCMIIVCCSFTANPTLSWHNGNNTIALAKHRHDYKDPDMNCDISQLNALVAQFTWSRFIGQSNAVLARFCVVCSPQLSAGAAHTAVVVPFHFVSGHEWGPHTKRTKKISFSYYTILY
jgi:hypothetical protein